MNKFIRQYIAIMDYGNGIDCLDTFGLNVRSIDKNTLFGMLNSDVVIRNINISGSNFREQMHIREPLQEKGPKSNVIFAKNSREYLCFNGKGGINKYSYDYIKANKELFIDIKFAGNGITSHNAQIPVASDIEIKSAHIINFNLKAQAMGMPQLNLYIEPVSHQVALNGIKGNNFIVGTDPYVKNPEMPFVQKLWIPDFVEKLKDSAFVNQNIEQVYIGDGITTIPFNCFSHISSLKYVRFGNNVGRIKEFAFSHNRNLQVLENMDSITVIEQLAFLKSGIEIFKAGKNLRAIGTDAFKGSKLREALLGNSNVVKIAEGAFNTETFNHLELSDSMKTLYTAALPKDMRASQIDIKHRINIALDNYSDQRKLLQTELMEKMMHLREQ